MALYNLARMTTATVGNVATINLGSAVAGFLTFNGAGVPDGGTVSYGIIDGVNSETGTGVYTAAGTTLTRTVTKSTAADARIALSGNAQVSITARAEDILNVASNLTWGGTHAFPLGAVATPSITFSGDLNTGMWSPAADMMAWSCNGVERMRLSPGGSGQGSLDVTGVIKSLNLVTAPTFQLTGASPFLSLGAAGVTATSLLYFYTSGLAGDYDARIYGYGGTAAIGQGNLVIEANVISVPSTAISTSSTSGALTVAGGVGVVGTLSVGSGIKFPAAQAVVTDGNTLDDYEEGSWTPALKFGGASAGMTYVTQLGSYIKIGKFVVAFFNVALSAKGSSVGRASFLGLPFSVGFYGGGAITSMGAMATSIAAPACLAYTDSVIYLESLNGTSQIDLTDTHFGNATNLIGFVNYVAAA